ncbi:MAG: hypothetical protein M0R40_04275 [Firmicutes bacterium]|nr:hypothetical protein [Bacillota bacterium]
MNRKLLVLIAVIVMLGAVLPSAPVFADSPFSTGNGDGLTAATAYEIANEEDLRLLAVRVNIDNTNFGDKFYKQTNDIELSEAWKNTETIGNNTHMFCGEYDGQGFKITNFKLVSESNLNPYYAGLFGYTGAGAKITGVNLVIPSEGTALTFAGTVQNFYIGALIGHINGATEVSECSLTGGSFIANVNITRTGTGANNGRIGGLIGYIHTNAAAEVSDCYSEADFKVRNTVPFSKLGATTTVIAGGLIGRCDNGSSTIDRCYVKGNVDIDLRGLTGVSSTRANVGGFMGGVGGVITNCYVIAEKVAVKSDSNAHVGAFGRTSNTSYGVSNCYVSGVSVDTNHSGSGTGVNSTSCFIGAGDAAYISNCYYGLVTSDAPEANQAAANGAVELDADELKNPNSFTGFDFSDIWTASRYVNNGSPVLRGIGEGNLFEITNIYFTVNGGNAPAASISASDAIEAKVSVDRMKLGAGNSVFIIAAQYDTIGNALIRPWCDNVAIPAGDGDVTVTLDVGGQIDLTGSSFKLMVWRDAKDMKPLYKGFTPITMN